MLTVYELLDFHPIHESLLPVSRSINLQEKSLPSNQRRRAPLLRNGKKDNLNTPKYLSASLADYFLVQHQNDNL